MRLNLSDLERMDAHTFNALKALRFDKSSVELTFKHSKHQPTKR